MNLTSILDVSESLVPANYLRLSLAAQKCKDVAEKELLRKRKLPTVGWKDEHIELFVQQLSTLDSNNFSNKIGVGEREARIYSRLVARRHYNFGHGIGRSGDLLEPQPKAAGSTLLANLTNALLLDLIHEMGARSCSACFLVPMATGMTLTLCLLTLKKLRPVARYVLWSRIDQKSCFKCMTTAGLEPIIVDPVYTDDNTLTTDVATLQRKVEELGESQIVCLFTTTSCFAPRECDDIVAVARLAKQYNMPHLVNNAYGLQSTYLMHQLEQGSRNGRVDLFVQSTDKNLMVPVGGAIVAGANAELVHQVAKTYAGRASSSQSLDVLMTLLSLGKEGYMRLARDRKDCFNYLCDKLQAFALEHNVEVLSSKRNPISLALTLNGLLQSGATASNVTLFGSMLFTRGVSGLRVIPSGAASTIDGYTFSNWGTHQSQRNLQYLTTAAAIGVTKCEIDCFFSKLQKCWVTFSASK